MHLGEVSLVQRTGAAADVAYKRVAQNSSAAGGPVQHCHAGRWKRHVAVISTRWCFPFYDTVKTAPLSRHDCAPKAVL